MIIDIPIFPLEGVIFFPETNLPLNIFESRYIEMIDYSLKKQKKIGMIQTKNKDELYSTGCVGEITSFEQTNDGRYLINLTGQNYFSIKKELSSKKNFRIVEAKIIKLKPNPSGQSGVEINKVSLLRLYQKFISQDKDSIDLNLVKDIDASMLVKFIAMTSPFSAADKQMLLETYDLNKLSENLEILFEYYLSNTKRKKYIN